MGLIMMMFNNVMKRFLCCIGWHEWVWTVEEFPDHPLVMTPPDDCKCLYCGVPYGDDEEEDRGAYR